VADIVTRQARRWKADLIVMGTHGRRGVNRMIMGSDAELVVRNAPMPVLLVRSGSSS
jgi:nucleotide-binding universal stress UspA family protein